MITHMADFANENFDLNEGHQSINSMGIIKMLFRHLPSSNLYINLTLFILHKHPRSSVELIIHLAK